MRAAREAKRVRLFGWHDLSSLIQMLTNYMGFKGQAAARGGDDALHGPHLLEEWMGGGVDPYVVT